MNFRVLNIFSGLTMRGRPPAMGQDVAHSYPNEPTPGTQTLINEYQKEAVATQAQAIKDLTKAVEIQNDRITSMQIQQSATDTRVSIFSSIIGLITGGGIYLQVRKKKRDDEEV